VSIKKPYFVAATVLVLIGVVTLWLGWCFNEKLITEGSFEGIAIGQDKLTTFRTVLELHNAERIHGFWGVEENPELAGRRHTWSESSESADFDRLLLYGNWTLIASSGRTLGVVRFRSGKLAFIDTYDSRGYISEHAGAWTIDKTAGSLRAGMTPLEALPVVQAHLSRGLLQNIYSWEQDVAPPAQFDASAFPALEPWDAWHLGTRDWGWFILTFKDGRLIEIHRRVQCVELP
jgi:hypothetical protein